jgi:GT2 family glycosyltransferase
MISIIIVHYHVRKDLFSCIASIYATMPKTAFEIIIVDNDEKKEIEKDLIKQFPKVRYIPNKNKGYGQGINTGARYAKGDYLFILNPDTKFLNNSIDALLKFFKTQRKAGIVAPVLFNSQNSPYPLQGTKELTPLRAIFALSFISKLFPKNKIYNDYYLTDWDKKSSKEIDCVPGTAFVIRKELFKKLGGFDEKFFLFFEEFDLCKKIKQQGWKIFITPSARIFHAWGNSTKKSKRDVNKIFVQSRFYYFRKHFGFLSALLTEGILRVNKYTFILLILVCFGLYLRLFNIDKGLSFIGDQGWYYLSARDLLLTGEIPLVGIASSHPWLHQGALWTYLLAPVLWLFHFHPVSGAYLSALIGILSIVGMYKLGSVMFSKHFGFIAAALFTVSPFVVFSDRVPYHTSPIPFFTIMALYSLYKWMQGNIYYFPFLIAMLAVLYNLEIAAFLFSILVIILWLYGYVTKQDWAKGIFKVKIIFLSVAGWLLVMLPMLLYDLTHGFPQTLKVLAWVGYRVLVFFGYSPVNPITPVSFGEMVRFVSESYKQMIFSVNGFVAFFILITSVLFLLMQLVKSTQKKPLVLLGVVNLFLLIGLMIVKTPSGAYLPMVVPSVILLITLIFEWLIARNKKMIQIFGIMVFLGVLLFNSYYIIKKGSADTFFIQRLEAAKKIVKEAGEKEYNLIGKGPGSEFESFTKNYEYLAWWLGNGPSKKEQRLHFVISEENYSVQVKKEAGDE